MSSFQTSMPFDKRKRRAKRKHKRAKKILRRIALELERFEHSDENKRISEDDCDFDFDNSTRPLCSTSEDDSDGPQGRD